MPLPSTIRAILFDLDGTLIELPNMDQFFDDLLLETLEDYHISIPNRDIRLALWHSGGDFEQILRSWGVVDYDAFIHTFDQRDLDKRRQLANAGEIRPFPDVTALKALHTQAKLGLVTNTPPEIATFELEFFHLRDHFDMLVMLGTVEQHIAKPEPDGLHRCLQHLQVPESQALMVGDSRSDILGGQRAGVGTVWVRRPRQKQPQDLEVPPDLVIDDLHELLDLFNSELARK